MKALKKILHFIWFDLRQYFAFVLMIVLFFVFVSFAERSFKVNTCKAVEISIYPEKSVRFINRGDIMNILAKELGEEVVGLPLSKFSFYELEKVFNMHNYVQRAEVYSDLNGNLYIDIHQKEPLLRIISVYGANYFLSRNGEHIPLSAKFSPRVLVASGYTEVSKAYPTIEKDLLYLADYISKDEFLSVLIGQIYVKSNRQLLLIPKVENLIIDFGDISDVVSKFNKLKVFYKKVLPSEGWNKYDKVDLRFNKQIILNKR